MKSRWTRSVQRWTPWLWARISIRRPGFWEYVLLAWLLDFFFFTILILLRIPCRQVALVYFFSMLPFLNRFCLTCTFFADCNEVEQEWRGDHDSHTWDNHWSCSILPTHCNSTCHDQRDQGPRTWCVSFDTQSSRTTNLLPTLNTYLFHSLDGTKRQSIKDMDGNLLRPKIRACSISGPFVLIVKEDDSIGLFMGETERGKSRRKDVSYGRQSSNSSRFSPVEWCWLFLFSSLDLEIPDRLLLRRHVRDVGEAIQK